MARCSFCANRIPPGTGKMLVMKDGKILHFCSSKCEKNHVKLKHKPRTTRWTHTFHKLKGGK
ncbi:50S ribosomal protein L24e [Candidatus Woesearchaeota archaeon]|nr:MAG: 50S ribosomal protein L24e [Candidatus Woesearchaeota archaeon]